MATYDTYLWNRMMEKINTQATINYKSTKIAVIKGTVQKN
jgi:hypothetical protein